MEYGARQAPERETRGIIKRYLVKTRVMWILGKSIGVRQSLRLEHASDVCWERTGGPDR